MASESIANSLIVKGRLYNWIKFWMRCQMKGNFAQILVVVVEVSVEVGFGNNRDSKLPHFDSSDNAVLIAYRWGGNEWSAAQNQLPKWGTFDSRLLPNPTSTDTSTTTTRIYAKFPFVWHIIRNFIQLYTLSLTIRELVAMLFDWDYKDFLCLVTQFIMKFQKQIKSSIHNFEK